jgi:hypothetical protein
MQCGNAITNAGMDVQIGTGTRPLEARSYGMLMLANI